MGVGDILCKASWFWALIVMVHPVSAGETLQITRNNSGDIFVSSQELSACTEETCVGITSGTATAYDASNFCKCKCLPHLPAFREDLQICVDDIHECALAPFVGGSTSQHIPSIYLPFKGQIVYPSKEIFIKGVHTQICAVVAAKYLTKDGWTDLKNSSDDVPFKLFRDEGRTFLQWVGEPDLRAKMSGRMIMVKLVCKELLSENKTVSDQKEVLPCVTFRVEGKPFKIQSNIAEVAFARNAPTGSGTPLNSDHLSASEYVAIGVCSIILGLIYVASVFLYLHLKKRNNRKRRAGVDSDSLSQEESGVIKNNPLLGIPHFVNPSENSYTEESSSENEADTNILHQYDGVDRKSKTSALIHSQNRRNQYSLANQLSACLDPNFQDSSNIECLPEENVSIVETLEGKDEIDNLRFLTGSVRKKLYFNPAYFEPHLLLAPPPAALEFLEKIREVIAVAKQKIANKRFTPTLLNIPEDEHQYSIEPSVDFERPTSRRGSAVSLKRKNSRREPCTGCPGCKPRDLSVLSEQIRVFSALNACQNCSDSKQNSIRKWLEDVPTLKMDENSSPIYPKTPTSPKRIRSPTKFNENINNTKRLMPSPVERITSPNPIEEAVFSKATFELEKNNQSKIRGIKNQAPSVPPPKPPTNKEASDFSSKQAIDFFKTNKSKPVINKPKRKMHLPPPDMIKQAIELENNTQKQTTGRVQTLTKQQMKAVINELTVHKNLLMAANQVLGRTTEFGYDTDSLERSGNRKRGYSTPSEYAEVLSPQASSTLSASLPVDEEITMRNDVYNKRTGNKTISRLHNKETVNASSEEHDYELIIMKKQPSDSNIPEFFRKNNGYSLVSEVYVNNGYNYGSNPSSPSGSNCSTLDRKTLKVKYDGGANKPGKLLIEVNDCLDHYIPVHDSDEFEPDTLDRPHKDSCKRQDSTPNLDSMPSLDSVPSQILLRTTGSFKSNDSVHSSMDLSDSGNLNRVFGSLREMFEEKRKNVARTDATTLTSDDIGRLLTLEERHSKRQRNLGAAHNGGLKQPDVIPPPPFKESIYECPKPPRKVPNLGGQLPSKNDIKGGAGNNVYANGDIPEDSPKYKVCLLQKSMKDGSITDLIQAEDLILKKNDEDKFVLQSTDESPFELPKNCQSIKSTNDNFFEVPFVKKTKPPRKFWQNTLRPEDSGYLSTDSNESKLKNKSPSVAEQNGSETDESLGDGHSESGAESIETHSVFFGRFRNSGSYKMTKSLEEFIRENEEIGSSDSETVSYTTVVPVVGV